MKSLFVLVFLASAADPALASDKHYSRVQCRIPLYNVALLGADKSVGTLYVDHWLTSAAISSLAATGRLPKHTRVGTADLLLDSRRSTSFQVHAPCYSSKDGVSLSCNFNPSSVQDQEELPHITFESATAYGRDNGYGYRFDGTVGSIHVAYTGDTGGPRSKAVNCKEASLTAKKLSSGWSRFPVKN
jgi:hypothetical protein